MMTIRFGSNSFPWNTKESEAKYRSVADLFVAAYIGFHTASVGTCTTTLGNITRALGKTTTSSLQGKHRKTSQDIVEFLMERCEKDCCKNDEFHIIRPDWWSGEVKFSKLLEFSIKRNSVTFKTGESFVVLKVDEYMKVVEVGQEISADPALFFGFYMYLRSWMRKMDLDRENQFAGCWCTRDMVLNDLKISYSTYLKYRDALHEAGLIYCLAGEHEDAPAMFALMDDQELWAEIELSYRGLRKKWAASNGNPNAMMDAAEDAMFRKGIGRVSRSVFYRMQQQEERKAARKAKAEAKLAQEADPEAESALPVVPVATAPVAEVPFYW